MYYLSPANGSTGIFLNGQPVTESSAWLHHLDVLGIAPVSMQLHIHKGLNTCQECEIGSHTRQVNKEPDEPVQMVFNKEKSRRREMKRLKGMYGLESTVSVVICFRWINFHNYVMSCLYNKKQPDLYESSQNPYVDRARIRRREVGLDGNLATDCRPTESASLLKYTFIFLICRPIFYQSFQNHSRK